MDFRLIFVRDGHTRLYQGMLNNEVMLFRVWRRQIEDVPAEDIQRAGFEPSLNPVVYYLYRDNWHDAPYEVIAGPLTFDGALSVVRAAVMSYNDATNYGAF